MAYENPNDELTRLLENVRRRAIEARDRHRSEAEQLAGYVVDQINSTAPLWNGWATAAEPDDDLKLGIGSGVTMLRSLDRDLTLPPETPTLAPAAHTAQTMWATTVTLASVFAGPSSPPVNYRPCPGIAECEEEVVRRLRKLDPSLADTYQQALQTLDAGGADPERVSLWQLRQVLDHLFEVLAPDEEVRKSNEWKPKEGDTPDQVTREERIAFAAQSRVPDGRTAQTLAASAQTATRAYRRLNQAHKRGQLDPERARNSFRAMDRIIRDWVLALAG